MAATDIFDITITGRGGHAAMPHQTIDPIVASSAIVTSLQSIASRNANPLESLVVSVTKFIGGSAYNIIPETVELAGTVRTLSAEMRDLAETRINEIVRGVAAAHGAEGSVNYIRNYPVTFNHSDETDFAADIAESVAGAGMASSASSRRPWAARISPSCSKPAPVPSSSWATATPQACTTRPMTSTTTPFRWVCPTGSSSPKRHLPPD
jgi:amidohydrolase